MKNVPLQDPFELDKGTIFRERYSARTLHGTDASIDAVLSIEKESVKKGKEQSRGVCLDNKGLFQVSFHLFMRYAGSDTSVMNQPKRKKEMDFAEELRYPRHEDEKLSPEDACFTNFFSVRGLRYVIARENIEIHLPEKYKGNEEYLAAELKVIYDIGRRIFQLSREQPEKSYQLKIEMEKKRNARVIEESEYNGEFLRHTL